MAMGCKPAMAMLAMQFTNAGGALLTRAALLQGMSPTVFVVYRQAIATFFIAPIAYFYNGRNSPSLGIRSFSLIFIASLFGVTINQNIYFEGLYLASSSVASAMGNLVPAVTFIVAAVVGIEKVKARSLTSIAKVVGTILCVGGAASIAFLKGPKLLNLELPPRYHSILHLHLGGGENWMLGCVFLFGSCCCWSFWLIMQVPISASYPDHLSLTAWMCFFSTLQSAMLCFFLEPDATAWKLRSTLQLSSCVYSGIVGSGFAFFIQSWCISRRGPLFTAMFNPLCTVIVTIFACFLLHEQLYTGSLAGSIVVVGGLYIVIWGESKDLKEMTRPIASLSDDATKIVHNLIDKASDKSCKSNLEESLVPRESSMLTTV